MRADGREAVGVAGGGFSVIHGDIGMFEQRVHSVGIAGVHTDADARRGSEVYCLSTSSLT